MRRALLVGINNYQHVPQLMACANDALDMAAFFANTAGFDGCRVLIDGEATTAAIKRELASAIAGLGPNDELVFSYSGHGTHFPTAADPEALCPVDFDATSANVITAGELKSILQTLARGARVTVFADCCYAGGILFAPAAKAGCAQRVRAIPAPVAADAPRAGAMALTLKVALSGLSGVLCVSACRSDQEASEVPGAHTNGVMTFKLLRELGSCGGLDKSASDTVKALGRSIQGDGFDQGPELHGDDTLFSQPLILP